MGIKEKQTKIQKNSTKKKKKKRNNNRKKGKQKANQPKLELVLPAFRVIFQSIEPQKKTQWIMSNTLYLKHFFVELCPLTP